MGTFSAFTCTLPLSGLSEWDARYLMAARNRGLRGLGAEGMPSAEAAECWLMEERRHQDEHYADGKHKDWLRVVGSRRGQWIGQFICPKPDPWGRHLLLDAHHWYETYDKSQRNDPPDEDFGGYVQLHRAGLAATVEPAKGQQLLTQGEGYYDDDEMATGTAGDAWDNSYTIFGAVRQRLVRCHTPRGVAHKGIGAGAVLYAALAMGATLIGRKGVYSIEGTRSTTASALWASARNPKTGPLAQRIQVPIELSNPDARVNIGDEHHCLDENLVKESYTTSSGCPITKVGCDTRATTTRQGTIGVDAIARGNVKLWGLMALHPTTDDGRLVTPAWKATDITKAFGKKATNAGIREHSDMLSPIGAELLSRAAIGDSPHHAAVIAKVLYGFSTDYAHTFLTREDVTAVLRATPAGRKIITDAGQGGALAGFGRAILRDAEAALYRPADPLRLTLPRLSRSAQAFINNYPDEG